MRPLGPTLPATGRQPRTLLPALAAGCALLAALLTTAQAPAAAAARPKAAAGVAKAAKAAKPANPPGTPARPASPHQTLSSQAKGLALATAITEAINPNQLDIAARVLTGAADCEFKQTVQVLALAGKPGLFTVEHNGKRYLMAPRETSTGAVRLEDPSAGVVWLQIPAKSMLMNARIGQRMIDGCQHAEQRIAMVAVAAAAQSLGIEARSAAPAAAAAAVPPEAASAAAPLAESAASATAATPAATSVVPAASAAPPGPPAPAAAAASR